ncbi:hypothetical protein [Tropicimonas sp. IMCC34043]|uniref:hypothetical protein n=1 Tax=Tropicimonas sp. IMCC34043 TaxID=2248760 RepID=UPI0013003AD8|nr:hypothetical protein [Tropicimonas sp. IMCC34043]
MDHVTPQRNHDTEAPDKAEGLNASARRDIGKPEFAPGEISTLIATAASLARAGARWH